MLTASASLLVAGCSSQAQENAPQDAPPAAAATQTTTDAATATKAPAPPKNYAVVPAKIGPAAPTGVAQTYAAAMKKVALAPPPASFKVADHPRVEMTTSRGKIVLELDATKAPLNVKSFVYLASKGFYKNTRFHRHADMTGDGKSMIIQGGDPLSADPRTNQFVGGGGPGYNVPLETSDLVHDQFVIAAARSDAPDSAGSQFYITQGATHDLDGRYTVFGKIVEGKDVAAKLVRADTLLAVKVLDAPEGKSAPKAP